MADYATEEEQIEALKRWWRENGRSVVLGVALGVLALVGWRGWEMYQRQQALGASAIYDQITQTSDYATVREHAERLRGDYADSAYAVLAALEIAALAVAADELEAAADWLQWAQENADDPALAALARLRFARVLVERGEGDRALTLLDAEVPEAYTGLYAELRGDILRERGEAEAAVAAYQRSLDSGIGPTDRALVERKLNRLRGSISVGDDDKATETDS